MLGFQDETWWTRLAQPDLFAWTASDPLRLGTKAKDPKGGGPEALACYGILRHDTGGQLVGVPGRVAAREQVDTGDRDAPGLDLRDHQAVPADALAGIPETEGA